MQTTLGVDVIGVVQPGAVQAVAATRNGRVGLLATPATVAQRRLRRGDRGGRPARRRRPSVACPELAPIIEARLPVRRGVVDTVRALLRAAARGRRRHRDPRLHALPAGAPDAPAHARPRRRARHAPARRSPARSSTCSARAGWQRRRQGEGDYRFLCTGDAEAFRALGTRFLQLPLGEVEHVDGSPTALAAA